MSNATKTTAQIVASFFNNNGLVFETPERVHITDFCLRHEGALEWRDSYGHGPRRYVFPDKSAIIFGDDCWDFGFVDCWCMAGELNRCHHDPERCTAAA